MFSTAAAAAAPPGKPHNPNNDYEVPAPPDDTVSEIAFSPTADYFTASSWDGSVKLWQVNQQDIAPRHAIAFEQPALCCTWAADGSKFFAGSTDKTVRMVDMTTGQTSQIGAHDAAVSSMRFVNTGSAQLLATASWDKSLRYWDMRSPQAALTIPLTDRCYAMDVVGPLAVLGTADRAIYIFNLNYPTSPVRRIESPLKYQTRCISVFLNTEAYAVGSIEGRVGIQMVDDTFKDKSFSFRCHREKPTDRDLDQVYAVNRISCHPTGIFTTAGSDGMYNFWDKESKQRVWKPANKANTAITATAFNRTGTMFAYAVGYDWSKGVEAYNPAFKTAIMIKPITDEQIKVKPKK